MIQKNLITVDYIKNGKESIDKKIFGYNFESAKNTLRTENSKERENFEDPYNNIDEEKFIVDYISERDLFL